MPESTGRRSQKTGLPPGTIIHVGSQPSGPPVLSVIDYDEQDWAEARDTVRKLHFMANFLLDIRAAEDRLDDEDFYDED